jgi:hypothetical protein
LIEEEFRSFRRMLKGYRINRTRVRVVGNSKGVINDDSTGGKE